MLGILGGLGVVGIMPSAWGWKLSLSAIFVGPLVAGVLEGGGQRVFLAFIGGGALLLGARLVWRPSP